MRIEKDTIGKKEVPEDAYYGVQTQRAIENFPVSGRTESPILIDSYILLKKACALTNIELEVLDEEKGKTIVKACDELLHGDHYNQFPIDVFQAGAGTSFNMNVNEVIANKALEISGKERGDYDYIHPNDHVNRSQSSNDTFPTASHMAIVESAEKLVDNLDSLAESFKTRGKEFEKIPKSGRTHLMDATPITLGDEFYAYGSSIERAIESISKAKDELLEIPIGGTATGSGTNTPEGYRENIIDNISELTEKNYRPAKDSFELIHSRALMSKFSSILKNLAEELNRIANDLRLLSSGPKTGISEINLPKVQPGSSIMPGKINPVMVECLNMICFQIMGRDNTISLANQAGQMEMNVMTPVITYNILDSISLLNNYLPIFRKKCIEGIEANEERCRQNYENSPSLATILTPKIGYMKAAEIAEESLEKNIPVPELVIEKGILTEQKSEELFDPKKVAKSKYKNK
ncbi:MAG: aspartate ammonia-lyase [Thermoplasmatota archaeon]